MQWTLGENVFQNGLSMVCFCSMSCSIDPDQTRLPARDVPKNLTNFMLFGKVYIENSIEICPLILTDA